MDHVAGLAECIISDRPDDTLRTYALSTCVGVTVYCPERKIMAVAHIVLPDSTGFEDERNINVMRYADTAIPAIFSKLGYKYGCTDRAKMIVRLFGGISSDSEDIFCIGSKNLEAVKKELGKLQLQYDDRETGGNIIRTLIAKVDNGDIEVIRRPLRRTANHTESCKA